MVCTTCSQSQPFTNKFFPKASSKTRGLDTRCKQCKSKISRARYLRRRIAVLTHYCNGVTPHCACCKETVLEFLTIDHINGGGTAERAKARSKKTYFIDWIIAQGMPEGLQVLCMNCNLARGLFGACPHQVGPIQAKVFDEVAALTLRGSGERRFD